ncbi:plasmid partitioning protein RepB (plasmid) [Bartonella sp. HY329]|uniref:plasmid partitioning protein RepB n=1 Tax=unclassified Bartonella TaxID=2645622 RepID=UPI0021C6362F|nr:MULTISPECIES: plasmid partitioning protein RepB [unclassified Bartonella]UXM96465.1 plasmid partitioning protein RepB [Bartonella sp. HY329]UXN10788.1 plasmid partitioning protein RepB [Bartonella sp. HY328]
MKAKTSKGLFAAVLSKLDEEKDDVSDVQQLARSSSPHLMKVAAGVKEMQARSKLADEVLRTGSQIVEIDPLKIKQSLIKDRLDSDYDDATIGELETSMRERGQIVPGLVRPIAGKVDEFEIVYGRRRLAVAKRLGIAFKAAIRALSDEEAIVFQGEENTARNDLSFIEKCLFAKAQEDAGFKREIICASLSTGKSHISEMIKLARQLPLPLLEIIGKAPSIGRGRWEELATLLKNMPNDDFDHQLPMLIAQCEIAENSGGQDFHALSSDAKFAVIFANLATNFGTRDAAPATSKSKFKTNKVTVNKSKWQSPDQAIEITVQKSHGNAIFTLKPKSESPKANNVLDNNNFDIGAQNSLMTDSSSFNSATTGQTSQNEGEAAFNGFADFLSSRLDALYSAYQQAAKTKKQGDQ